MRRLTRAWLAWCELWRSDASLEQTVADLRDRELTALAVLHEHRLSRPDLDVLVVLLDGLRAAVSASVRPISVERAREVLRSAASAALTRSA